MTKKELLEKIQEVYVKIDHLYDQLEDDKKELKGVLRLLEEVPDEESEIE